jgi:hypothetical protein
LKAVFGRHEVRAEQVTEEGRADIVIRKKTQSKSGYPATVQEWVLELKALVDHTHTGNQVPPAKARHAVREGLDQVIAYKSQLHAVSAALCCYDMREKDEGDDECFKHIAVDASAQSIALWRWFLFRSAKASRAAG